MSDKNEAVFQDNKDWLEAVVFLIFLIVFPVGIYLLWQEPREKVPLYLALPFTAIFLITVPFMMRRVLDARSRTLSMCQDTGDVTIVSRSPWLSDRRTIVASSIKSAVFETTDNDGYWFKGMIRTPDDDVVFAQGSYRPGVHAQFEAMVEELRRFNPDLRIEHIEG